MSTPAAPGLAALVAAPEWLPQQLDFAGRRALFVRLDAERLRAAAFLDERVLAGAREGCWVPLEALLAHAGALPRAAPHAVFHVGHCGSTLVANLLDRLPGTLALREPLVLRTLAELREELDRTTARCDAEGWQALSDALLALLARPHGELRPLAKATSNCNALLDPWLARHRDARALALRIALEPWLATLLKSPAAVADALRFAPARLQDLHARVGESRVRLPSLSVPEQLALGWVAERARFAAAHAAHGERVLELDFAVLLDGGPAVLARIAAHFGLAHDDDALARAWHPDVLGRYAKARDHAYSPADRDADLAQSRRRFAAEIDAGMRYAEALYARYPALPR